MSNIVYTVLVGDECIPNINTPEKASRIARRVCKENPECPVFITWFRDIDQCRGFLNSNGDHTINGQNWQK